MTILFGGVTRFFLEHHFPAESRRGQASRVPSWSGSDFHHLFQDSTLVSAGDLFDFPGFSAGCFFFVSDPGSCSASQVLEWLAGGIVDFNECQGYAPLATGGPFAIENFTKK